MPLAGLALSRSERKRRNGDSSAVTISVDQLGRRRRQGTIRLVETRLVARQIYGVETGVDPQAMIYFGIAGGSLALALSLLYARYVRRDPQALRSGGGFTLFAICMLLCAIGAAAAGLVSMQGSR